MPRTLVTALALLAVLASLARVPSGSADPNLLVTVALPDLAAVGDSVTATVTLASVGPTGPPAGPLHVTYDPTVLTLVQDDELDCTSTAAGVVDCSVIQFQFSLAFTFVFRVLQASQTTVTATDGTSSGTGTLNAPPTQFDTRTPPVLSGEATVGSTLSTTSGTWEPSYDYAYSYHWDRCTPSNSFCATLNATGPTYTLTPADAGCTLTGIVTATAGTTSISRPTAPSAVVQPAQACSPAPAPSPPPTTTASAPPPVPRLELAPSALPFTVAQGQSPYTTGIVIDGVAPFTMAVVDGALPAGIVLDNGFLHGIAIFAGHYRFTLEVRDASGAAASRTFTLDVVPGTAPAPPRAAITGLVSAGGRPLAGALVTMRHGSLKKRQTTGRSGRFSFTRLHRVTWRLTVTKRGYSTVRRGVTPPGRVAVSLRRRSR